MSKAKVRTSRKRKRAAPAGSAPPVELRRRSIEVAAYYIAEREGFPPGCELDHWLRAESEIDRRVR